MTDIERTAWLWAAFILLAFLTTCAVVDLVESARPISSPVVEDGPPPSMVTQVIEEAKAITRWAADHDDAG